MSKEKDKYIMLMLDQIANSTKEIKALQNRIKLLREGFGKIKEGYDKDDWHGGICRDTAIETLATDDELAKGVE